MTVVAVAWRFFPPRFGGPAAFMMAGLLGMTVVAAYRYPLHIGGHTKLQLATVPYYLMAALLAPPMAASVAGCAALAGELALKRKRGSLYGDVAGAAGRRALIVLAGALVIQAAPGRSYGSLLLVSGALIMGALEVVTAPIIVWPISLAPPRQTMRTFLRDSYLFEGALYLVGLLGALAARQQLWAIVLLALPTALVYLAFRAMQQAHEARRDAEDARARAAEAQRLAEQAVTVRDDFLTVASHDLRTPLTNIVGRTDIIQMRLDSHMPLTEEWLRAHLAPLRQAADRMAATVEEMTDAAQLQMGEALSFDIALVDLRSVVRHVAALTGPDRERCLLVEPALPAIVRGDCHRLERVVQNLVDNALKFSHPPAPISVTLQRDGDWQMVQVCDNCRGIPPQDLPAIFTRYYRGSNSTATAGSGIGLAGARAIVEQHGGRIDVESTLGHGTTVTVYLPVPTVRGKTTPPIQADPAV